MHDIDFFFSSRRRHTRCGRDWSSDVCSSDLCGALHGHTYTVEVRVRGEIDPVAGWVCDFGDIKDAFRPIEAELDHKLLNDVTGLDNPTSEMLAQWIWGRLAGRLGSLYSVSVS